MAIPLGGTKTGHPSIKFRDVGQYVDMALVDVGVVPWKDYVTGAVKKTDDGKERSQEVVTGLVIRATAVTTTNEVDNPAPVGELVSVFCAGHHRWDWVQAQKALDGGGMMVGDVVRITYTGEEAGKGASPKKVWKFQLRHPRPEEAAQTAQCERLNQGTAAGVPITGSTATAQDEEPF